MKLKLSLYAIVFCSLLLSELPVSAAGGGGGGTLPPGTLGLSISNEVGPAGGVVQMKLSVTEPRPIVRGTFSVSYDPFLVEDFLGISVTSPNGDACGVASWQNGVLRLELTSPGQDLGMSLDYPIVTIAVRLRAGASPGSVSPFAMQLSDSSIINLFGQPYPTEIKSGTITVGGTLSVSNVTPGGGLLNTGSVISIYGQGFDPKSDVRINTDAKYTYTVPSSTEIRVTARTPINLQSDRIVIKSGKETLTYYSYLRAIAALPVGDTAITRAKPLPPTITLREGTLDIPAADFLAAGFDLENPSGSDAAVRADLYAGTGELLGSRTFTVPAWGRLSVDAGAAYPGVPLASTQIRFYSNTPFEAMGLIQSSTTGAILPANVAIISR